MTGNKGTVVVAMSGGVDSSVAAALLRKQGYDCIGVFMRLGSDPAEMAGDASTACAIPGPSASHFSDAATATGTGETKSHQQGCCSAADAADARYVAGLLDIPFYALNFQHDFSGIIDYFVREYNRGRTPNPCVRCNEYLKFGKLLRYASAIGADYVATGHYARIGRDESGAAQILRGIDQSKDQSYVLFGVPREDISRILLPIGHYPKSQVRQLARELGLPVHNKRDSQEICFVPDNDYMRLVKRRTPEAVAPGPVVDSRGRRVATHAGHQNFTLGQRRGVGVAFGYPIYVTAIDAANNTLTIGNKEDLLRTKLIAREVNWLTSRLQGPFECTARVRYNTPAAPAIAELTGPDELTVCFAQPVAAITPGQAVVCYSGDRLLGGAWIDQVPAEDMVKESELAADGMV